MVKRNLVIGLVLASTAEGLTLTSPELPGFTLELPDTHISTTMADLQPALNIFFKIAVGGEISRAFVNADRGNLEVGKRYEATITPSRGPAPSLG